MEYIDNKELVKKALEARNRAYTPYSNYNVGAALLATDGTVILGCNIENASFGPTICAERTAFFKAISEGIKSFKSIAIVGGPKDEMAPLSGYAFPCGVCRQVMREFCSDDFEIIVGKSENDYRVYTLGELLPNSFGPDNLS